MATALLMRCPSLFEGCRGTVHAKSTGYPTHVLNVRLKRADRRNRLGVGSGDSLVARQETMRSCARRGQVGLNIPGCTTTS